MKTQEAFVKGLLTIIGTPFIYRDFVRPNFRGCKTALLRSSKCHFGVLKRPV